MSNVEVNEAIIDSNETLNYVLVLDVATRLASSVFCDTKKDLIQCDNYFGTKISMTRGSYILSTVKSEFFHAIIIIMMCRQFPYAINSLLCQSTHEITFTKIIFSLTNMKCKCKYLRLMKSDE